jgi:hypothetical protein
MGVRHDMRRRRPAIGLLRAAVLAFACATAMPALSAESAEASGSAVKMAIVYNLGKFIDWPGAAHPGTPLELCVSGSAERLEDGLAAIEGKAVHGRALKVRRLGKSQDFSGCHIVFFSESLTAGAAELLASTHLRGMLTISDDEAFAGQGGIVTLVVRDRHVRFQVHLSAAQRAGFTISSELLRVADKVIGGPSS